MLPYSIECFFISSQVFCSVQFSSVAQSCPTLCDPMNHSRPGIPVHLQLPEFTQTHVHLVSDAIQPSHPLSHEVVGPEAMIFVFWMLSFKPTYSLSSFTFIKRLFSSSSLSDIRVVSSAYLRLLIFLPAILIPTCILPVQRFSWCTLHIS